MYVPISMIFFFILGWAIMYAIDSTPRRHIDPCPAPRLLCRCFLRAHRLRPQMRPAASEALPRPAHTRGYLSYLWLPLGLTAFVALSLLAHTFLPR